MSNHSRTLPQLIKVTLFQTKKQNFTSQFPIMRNFTTWVIIQTKLDPEKIGQFPIQNSNSNQHKTRPRITNWVSGCCENAKQKLIEQKLKREKETSSEGLDQTSSAALEISEDLFNGSGIVSCSGGGSVHSDLCVVSVRECAQKTKSISLSQREEQGASLYQNSL